MLCMRVKQHNPEDTQFYYITLQYELLITLLGSAVLRLSHEDINRNGERDAIDNLCPETIGMITLKYNFLLSISHMYIDSAN